MAELAAAAGLPRPEIEDAGACLTVRFRPAAVGRPKSERLAVSLGSPVAFNLNARQRDILDLLRHSDQPLALREIRVCLAASLSVRQVKRALARLRELGLATTTGHGVSARWKPGSDNRPDGTGSLGP